MFQGSRPFGGRLPARLAASLTVALASVAVGAGSASAAGLSAHGQLLHLAPGLKLNANQSSNWFGYSQGTLEQGSKLFNSISGDWTVPAATAHTSGTAEASSDWIGIGGGCVDAGCTVTDSTLIQTGTEQDVDATGAPSYSAWWELVPAPSITVSNMTVAPGDHMHASVSELVNDADVWNITIQDVTKGESFSTDGPVSIDPRHGGVDRGDAAGDRHRRRLRRAAQSDQSGVQLRRGQRLPGQADHLGADAADRLQQQRDRDAIGAQRRRQRLRRLLVGHHV